MQSGDRPLPMLGRGLSSVALPLPLLRQRLPYFVLMPIPRMPGSTRPVADPGRSYQAPAHHGARKQPRDRTLKYAREGEGYKRGKERPQEGKGHVGRADVGWKGG